MLRELKKEGAWLPTYMYTDCITDSLVYNYLKAQIITVKKKNDQDTVIVNVYRPPSGVIDCFIEKVTQIVETVSDERYKDIYLLGDFNIDHHASKRTKAAKSLESTMLGFGLVQYISSPNRVTFTTKSLIDVIYIRSTKVIRPFIITTSISGHYLVGTARFLDYTSPKKTEFSGRTYQNYPFEQAKCYYAGVNRDLIYTMHDVDLVWEILFRIITNCANVLCPIKVRKSKPTRLPWLTPEVTEIIHDRDDLFLEAYANSDPSLLKEAKSLKTKAKKAVRNAQAT